MLLKCLVFIGCVPHRVAFVVGPIPMVRNGFDANGFVESDVAIDSVDHFGIFIDSMRLRVSVVCVDSHIYVVRLRLMENLKYVFFS